VYQFKYLGVLLDCNISWNEHIDMVCSKVSQRIGLLRRLRSCLTVNIASMLYRCMILPLLEYCDIVWENCNITKQRQLQVLQNRAARVILQMKRRSSVQDLHSRLNWKYLTQRRKEHMCVMVFKCINGLVPTYLDTTFVHNHLLHSHNTRQASLLHKPNYTNTAGHRTFAYRGATYYNTLSADIRHAPTLRQFKAALRHTTPHMDL